MATQKQSVGRPKGATKKQMAYEIVEATPSRCRACGSTSRERYTTRHEQRFGGYTKSGHRYTSIIRRRTACADCGQHRIDRSYENRPEAS